MMAIRAIIISFDSGHGGLALGFHPSYLPMFGFSLDAELHVPVDRLVEHIDVSTAAHHSSCLVRFASLVTSAKPIVFPGGNGSCLC